MHVFARSVVSATPCPQAGVSSAAAQGPSAILFIVWPEPGHVTGPLALARRLQARGERVVFAGLPEYRPFIERHGHDFRSLAAPPNDPPGPSVFACPRSEADLAQAVRRLVAAFDAVCVEYAPAAVLIDSLYSAFTLLPAARGLPWATYETDLPRELDLGSPPLPCQKRTACAAPVSEGTRVRRSEWARLLWATYRSRRAARQSPAPGQFSMQSDFPDRLSSALGARVGRCVAFDRRSAFTPVAQGPRLVFSSEALDFVRTRRLDLSYGGPCIDTERSEPAFDGSRVPQDKQLVYCSLGTQSFREAQAPALLRTIIAAVTCRPDLCLVVACPAKFAESLSGVPERVIIVKHAPQLTLLRRARLAITHAGFNGVKECALFGVPQLVLPLSHDQPRNAALVERLGIGVALCPSELSAPRLLQAIDDIRANRELERRCHALRRHLEAENATPAALQFVDRLMLRRTRVQPSVTENQ